MATSELIAALQALAHERKIDEFYLIERLEDSLAKSYQHILDLEWDARVTIDRNTGTPHSLRIRRILFEFPFLHFESGLFYLRLIFLALFFIYFISIFPSSSNPTARAKESTLL